MNWAGAVALVFCGTMVAQDAREIVRRSIVHDNANWERARNYSFVQRVEERKLDDQGKPKSVESRTYDATVLAGEVYRKLVARNDQPLSAAEKQKEQAKLLATATERQQTLDATKANVEKARQKRQRFLQELPEAYSWKVVGEEVISGRPVYVITAEPVPGHHFNDAWAGRVLPKIHGKLWVDKQDYQWVRSEAEVLEPMSIGWFLARLAPGARFYGEQKRINDEVWLPDHFQVHFDARLALLKRLNEQMVVTFKEYKKFSTDSRVVFSESSQ